MKDSFVFHKNWYSAIKDLDDSYRLEVLDAILSKVFDGEKRSLSSIANVAMKFIEPQMNHDIEKYNRICEQRKLIGSKGGIAKATKSYQKVANGSKRYQTLANVADNDNDNDNDIQDTNVSMSIEEEDTNVSKKSVRALSDLEKEFDEFRVKYKHYGGKARGLQTEFDNLKKKHKDWKDIIPLLNNAIENENKARKEADAMGKFFPNMKNLQTYINNRSWESYITDGTEVSNNEYRPLEFGVQQKWNQTRKCLEISTPYPHMINDGYSNDNRPDGAAMACSMYMWKWSVVNKQWILQK